MEKLKATAKLYSKVISVTFADGDTNPADSSRTRSLNVDAPKSKRWHAHSQAPGRTRLLQVLLVGLLVSACGAGLEVTSEPQQSGLSKLGDSAEYRVSIEIAPGALDEATDGWFTVKGSVMGSGGRVPAFEVSGGDPLAIGGRKAGLGRFEFRWDWNLPEDCGGGCKISLPLKFTVVEEHEGTAGIGWLADFTVETPYAIEEQNSGRLDGVITVEPLP